MADLLSYRGCNISGQNGTERDICPGVQTGHGAVTPPRRGGVPLVPAPVPAFDPAAPYATKRARRAAWGAWEQAGEPWPPPAGLVSATLDACRGNGTKRDRWKR